MSNEFLHTLCAATGIAALIISAAFLAVTVQARIRYWISEGKKLQEPGYWTPEVSFFARVTRALLGRITIYLRVGRLILIGRANLKYKGRLIILPNHTNEKDAVLSTAIFGTKKFRFLMAVTQVTSSRAPLVAWQGGIAVHHERNPSASVRTAVKALSADEDSSLLVFSQGELFRDNSLLREKFQSGALAIGRLAAKKSKLPFAILPVGIYYDRDPGHATLLFRAARLFGIGWFSSWFGETTFGATVAFGEPLPLDDLPEDQEAAMDIVFDRIRSLCLLAEQETKRRLG